MVLFSWKRKAVRREKEPERTLDQKLFDLRCTILDFIEWPFRVAGTAYDFIRRNIWNS